MCNGRLEEKKMEKQEAVYKKQSFDEIFARFVLSPHSRYIIAWNLITTLVYATSIFIDTVVIGFHLQPLLNPALQTTTSLFSAIMIIDVGLKFFVAFRANTAEMNVIEDDEDEILHTGDGEHQIAAQRSIRKEKQHQHQHRSGNGSQNKTNLLDHKKYSLLLMNARAKDI